MKKQILSALAGMMVLGVAMVVYGQAAPVKEGSKPYTPTRLEWLANEFKTLLRTNFTSGQGYGLSFVADHTEDSIIIYVRYNIDVDRAEMNKSIDQARKIIRTRAEHEGWDNWLSIREDVEMFDATTDN